MGHADTHRMMHDLFNDSNLDAMSEHFADDVAFDDVPQGSTATGADGVLAWLQGWKTGFSDAQVAQADYLEGPDHSVAFFQAQGTQDGEFGPLPPSGQKLDAPFCEVVRYNDEGKVVSAKLYYDQMTMMQQLGAMESQQ